MIRKCTSVQITLALVCCVLNGTMSLNAQVCCVLNDTMSLNSLRLENKHKI
jgi:hypothetical protein